MRIAHHAMTWEGFWDKNKLDWSLDQLLRDLKSAGYDALEIGVNEARFGDAATVANKARDAGVTICAVASHVTANPWPPNTDQYRREFDYAAALGVKTVMICGGFLGYRRTTFESDYQLFGQNLSAACDYAGERGLSLAYHPHLGCIVETIAETQRLLKHAPAALKLCLDTGHLIAAGDSPVDFLRMFGRRVTHVHLKDRDVTINKFAELGTGNAGLDFGATFAELRRMEYSGWIVVERDGPQVPAVKSAATSRAFLRGLGL